MTTTQHSPAAPSAEALNWASHMIERLELQPWSKDVLAELYTPDLPDLLEEFESAVDVLAEARHTSSMPLPDDCDLALLLRRLEGPDLVRLVLWSSATVGTRLHQVMQQTRSRGEPSSTSLAEEETRRSWLLGLLSDTCQNLVRGKLPWDSRSLALLLRCGTHDRSARALALDACERVDDHALTLCRTPLEEMAASMRTHVGDRVTYWDPARDQQCVRALRLLVRTGRSPSGHDVFLDGDPLPGLIEERHPDALDTAGGGGLLLHCLDMRDTRPRPGWTDALPALFAEMADPGEFLRRVLEPVPLAPPAPSPTPDYRPAYFPDRTVSVLRGALWALDSLPRETTAWAVPSLERIIAHTGVGPRNPKVPRAERLALTAVEILGRRGGEDAVVALARVRSRLSHKGILKKLDATLRSLADDLGITREELMERTVPDFGLDADGTRTETLDGTGVTLSLERDGTAVLGFTAASGPRVASAPKALRTSSPERLKELRAELKELRTTVSAVRVRLEEFLGEGRVWDVAPWREHYLDHPVTGSLSRCLVWEASDDGGATWAAGLPEPDGEQWRLVGPDGATVLRTGATGPRTRVRLWHPVRDLPDAVRAWRDRLDEREVLQPVKQAFREIYLLTPAEEDTGSYSLRFAAHILKYPQAKALLNSRGWTAPQLGLWNGGEEDTGERLYTDRASGTRWRAVFRVTTEEAPPGRTPEVCGTDRVYFLPEEGGAAVALAGVPALVLSEAMRDLDLAVGVTSIAADPTWADRDEAVHMGYWRRTAFGELTENAEVRRAALERLVPRLRIADRLELTDRFLRVRGDLRTYRIHLGSANILMEPDDSYLCVVETRRKETGLFLPFEEDGGRLSVILSKALLLANDTKISDPGIAAQIRRGLPEA